MSKENDMHVFNHEKTYLKSFKIVELKSEYSCADPEGGGRGSKFTSEKSQVIWVLLGNNRDPPLPPSPPPPENVQLLEPWKIIVFFGKNC